jgi:hypothetical protein
MILLRRGAHRLDTRLMQVQSTLIEVNMLHAPALVPGNRIRGRPMAAEVQASGLEASNPVQERHKHPRHRYIERLYVGKADGTWFAAMTYEISAGGAFGRYPRQSGCG